MGDVAIAAPVIYGMKKSYPDHQITVVTKSVFAPILRQIPEINVIEYDHKGIHKGFLGLIRFARQIPVAHYTHIIDLHDVVRTKILRRLLGFSRQVTVFNKDRKTQKRSLTQSLDTDKFYKVAEDYCSAFAKAWQLYTPPLNKVIRYLPKPSTITLDRESVRPRDYLVIAPFAAHPGKSLSVKAAIRLVQKIKKLGRPILLLGGGNNEVEILGKLANESAINCIAGKYSIEQECAFLAHAAAVIAMDTGNGHIAAMYGTPVVTIWGVTHPTAGYVPLGQPIENQILPNYSRFPNLPDSLFGKQSAYGSEIFDHFTFDEVTQRLGHILNK